MTKIVTNDFNSSIASPLQRDELKEESRKTSLKSNLPLKYFIDSKNFRRRIINC